MSTGTNSTGNYRSSNRQVRAVLDRPRVEEWIDYELEHLKKLTGREVFIVEQSRRGLIHTYEERMKSPGAHELAVLVDLLAVFLPVEWHRYLHQGLTSSNVIDACNHRRWAELILFHRYMWEKADMTIVLATDPQYASPVVGMTHGKRADITSVRSRLNSLAYATAPAYKAMHNMAEWFMEHSYLATGPVGYDSENGNRQAVHRFAYNQLWAALKSVSAANAQCAQDYRFYCSDLECGVAGTPAVPVGSSCMAHKQNPTEFERVVGLDHLIGGMVSTLITLPPMWLDRDLVHSSVERETIDRLWDTVFYQCELIIKLVRTTNIRVPALPGTLSGGEPLQTSSQLMQSLLDHGQSRSEAQAGVQLAARHGALIETTKQVSLQS